MENYTLIFSIVGLVAAAGLAFIPANIAKSKGYSFGLWWFYGWMLFIVAIIHVNTIPDKNENQITNHQNNSASNYLPVNNSQSVAEELRKFKELKDDGVISEEEFQSKKEHLLKFI